MLLSITRYGKEPNQMTVLLHDVCSGGAHCQPPWWHDSLTRRPRVKPPDVLLISRLALKRFSSFFLGILLIMLLCSPLPSQGRLPGPR